MNRRTFLAASAAGAVAASGILLPTSAAQTDAEQMKSIKALTFDMGGTVFDWHHSVRDEVRRLAASKSIQIDAADFANRWRRQFFRVLIRVRRGTLEAKNADVMHRIALDEVLAELGIGSLTENEKDSLNFVWHRLRTWPDVKVGLRSLRTKYIVSGFSILSFGILVDGSKRAGLSWDSLISCEFLGYYKPDPNSYKKAAELLGLKPTEVMMVAAHKSDLRAAMSAGFLAAYTPRPLEYGVLDDRDLSPESDFAVNAKDFIELASLIV